MFSGDPAAYEQHHEFFSSNDSVDSAAHLSAFGSAPTINARLTPQGTIEFPGLVTVPSPVTAITSYQTAKLLPFSSY
jgi:hypothetical protein